MVALTHSAVEEEHEPIEARVQRFQSMVATSLRRAVRAGTAQLGEVVTAATGPPEQHTSAMVALVPSEEELDRLTLEGGEPREELHLTLLFFGDASELPEGLVTSLQAQLEEFASEGTMLQGNAFAVNHFNPHGEDPALVLGIGGTWLPEVHGAVEQMAADTDTGDWAVPEQHAPWVAHVTLAYQPTADHFEAAAERLGPIEFDRVRLAVGSTNYDYDMTHTVTAAAQPEAVDPNQLAAIEQAWRVELASTLLPEVGRVMELGSRDALAELVPRLVAEVPVTFDLRMPAAELYLAESENRLRGIGDDLWRATRLQLVDGMARGEDVAQLTRRVRSVLASSDVRARTIARTEVIGATNAGSYQQVQLFGAAAPTHKVWLATGDSRTRLTHRAANGQTRPLTEKFSVGGSSLEFPGDPRGSAEEVVNCRCTLTWVFKEET